MKTLRNSLAVLSTFTLLGSLSQASVLQLGEDAQLHVLGDLQYVYEDNLFLLQNNEVSDRYLVFSPGLELRMAQEGTLSAVLRYQHSFTRYRDFDSLNGDYSDLSVKARYNSGVVLASAYLDYEELYTSLRDVALAVGGPVEREEIGAGGNLRYEISELTAFRIGVDYDEVDYELDRYTDYDSLSVPLTFFYKVRPKVDLTGGLRYRNTNTTGPFDYEDLYYFVGAVGELFSPVVFADVSIGFQERDYDGAATDASSASYDITFIYTGDPKATVYAGLSRDYRTSAVGGTAYAFSSASIGARYDVTDKVGLNAALVIGESEYEESPRAEDMTILTFGASYQPNDYLTLQASYEYTDVEGANVFSSTYTNNEIQVSASLRY
jgi:hypothetical protein